HSLGLSSQELLDANSQMRAVFQAIPDLVFRLDHQGTILDIKAGATSDLMLKRQDLIGKRVQNIPLKDVARQFSAAIERVIAENVPVNIEYSAVLQGQESHYDARLAPLPEKQIAVIIRNVTERKQSLRLLGSAVEQSTESIVISEAQLDWPGARYLFVNPAFTRMTGYTAAEALGQTPRMLQGPKSDRAELRRMRDTLRRGESYAGETIAYRKDGTELQMERQVVPIRNSSGTITHFLGIQRDVTARKQAESALRESNEKFRQLAENITDLFWIRSPDMRELQYISPAFERIWGRPRESLYANPQLWAEAILPEDRERVRTAFATLMGAAPSISIEYRIAQPAGEVRWVHARGFQVRDAEDTLIRLMGVVTDITERKRTEHALRESEEHFRFLHDVAEATDALADPHEIMTVTARMLGEHLHASHCAYADVDKDGRHFTILHDYAEGIASTGGPYQLSHFGAKALAKLNAGQTLIIRNLDRDLLPGDGADMFTAIGAKAIVTCPLIKEGGLRALMAVHQTTPRDWTPGEVAIVQEVVERCWAAIERRTAQARLRESKRFAESIAENSTSLIYVIDLETGRNTYANRNIAERLGYSQEQIRELGDSPLPRLIHPDDLGRVVRHFAQFADVTDSRVIDLEYRLKHADGDWRWIWARDTVFNRRPDGSAWQVMGSAQDITQRKRADADLEAAHKQLVDTARQAGMAEIATNVLHNVGNILNSVNVSAGLVSATLRSSKAQDLSRGVQLMNEHAGDLGDYLTRDEKGRLLPGYLADFAQALAQEQHGMIEELKNLARSVDHIKDVVATQQSYAVGSSVIEPVQICELAEDALRMSGDSLARHQVTVVRDFSPVPVTRLDRARVLQILVNLISNAKNAMEEMQDAPHRLTLRVDIAAGSRLRIQVKDEGEGIPAQNLTRIFAHGFTTRKSGHGFGLHSCALAAKQMGGTLSAHSDGPGRGATFTLELPIDTAGSTK
ncbi:MAG TPA: PAS domain S-box protein, partial [Ramlibacter sp.]|nr:PAS domain S-box protein [Ramlibacter sp.]